MRISDWSSDVCSSDLVLVCFDRFFVERFSLFFEQDVVLLQFQCREFLRAFGVEQRAAEALINRTGLAGRRRGDGGITVARGLVDPVQDRKSVGSGKSV